MTHGGGRFTSNFHIKIFQWINCFICVDLNLRTGNGANNRLGGDCMAINCMVTRGYRDKMVPLAPENPALVSGGKDSKTPAPGASKPVPEHSVNNSDLPSGYYESLDMLYNRNIDKPDESSSSSRSTSPEPTPPLPQSDSGTEGSADSSRGDSPIPTSPQAHDAGGSECSGSTSSRRTQCKIVQSWIGMKQTCLPATLVNAVSQIRATCTIDNYDYVLTDDERANLITYLNKPTDDSFSRLNLSIPRDVFDDKISQLAGGECPGADSSREFEPCRAVVELTMMMKVPSCIELHVDESALHNQLYPAENL